ncbi:MAG: nicotinamide mononucleotide transporter [Cytophagaceae bacterium]|nr:nicotinamide mononucleotide transporter [Cytophagaceae bacterium]MBK9935105.1 nicotinamide mononucleotide transporter [Cytophagaceae bacterium]MBL0301547.1 nicotinamide mononucleotide transporter [Cytophagaceae bacterium]MBL0324370.1 nicotinamide mononucleotide transporter [Cytophagaceae bacterium]
MIQFFDIKNIFFTFWGYPMSHLEFWATLTGGYAVWLSAKENVWSWMVGLINVVLAAIMFYQIQLYPDMFLQGFFFITNIIGFWLWKFPKESEANQKQELKITRLTQKNALFLIVGGLITTALMGTFSKNLHEFFPKLFSLPSAFPYMDSFTTVMSIVATFMLMKKKVEAWWMWLAIDLISTYMYFVKDVKLYSLLYAAFCVIATFGAMEWTKKYRKG